MRLLILNWRDIRSPRAGGAELLTHEIAKRLVARGHEVTWFTSRSRARRRTEDDRRSTDRATWLGADDAALRAAVRRAERRAVRRRRGGDQHTSVLRTAVVSGAARSCTSTSSPARCGGTRLRRRSRRSGRRASPCTCGRTGGHRDHDLRFDCGGSSGTRPAWSDRRHPDGGEHGARRRAARQSDSRGTSSRSVASRHRSATTMRSRLLPSSARSHPDATLTIVGSGRDRASSRCMRVGWASAMQYVSRARWRGREDRAADGVGSARWHLSAGRMGTHVTEAALRGTPSVVYDVPGFRDSVATGERVSLLNLRLGDSHAPSSISSPTRIATNACGRPRLPMHRFSAGRDSGRL